VCWATLVAAELIAAQRGIGAMMVEAQNFFQTPTLVLGIILIGFISLVMDAIVRLIEARATRWQEKDELVIRAGTAWRKASLSRGWG
jgi:NitT/TauT family transport system permease protein